MNCKVYLIFPLPFILNPSAFIGDVNVNNMCYYSASILLLYTDPKGFLAHLSET